MASATLKVELEKSEQERKVRSIKVVIWDLDHTVWDGVLLEDPVVTLRPGVVGVIQELDRRGILQSTASKNDPATALGKLKEFGLDEYFLYPQIGWGAKSASVRAIGKAINVGIDTLAFIDDQPFEREEVAHELPEVLCLDEGQIERILERTEFNPRFITEDSRYRRQMYQSDIKRNELEQEFEGPQDAFLATLGLQLTFSQATKDDLQRAEELTKRTHQLNTTGYTYDYDELAAFVKSAHHELWIASLEDRFGTYGKIGLCLIELGPEHWTLKLLLMSCRVMSRGVGGIMISHVLGRARAAGVTVCAEFIRTDRNRMMYITYRFANFKVLREDGDLLLLENDCSVVQDFPPYAKVTVT